MSSISTFKFNGTPQSLRYTIPGGNLPAGVDILAGFSGIKTVVEVLLTYSVSESLRLNMSETAPDVNPNNPDPSYMFGFKAFETVRFLFDKPTDTLTVRALDPGTPNPSGGTLDVTIVKTS